jgi:transposase
MRKYIRIGVDIAKNCFQVHALESEDCSATKRRLSRSGIVKFLAEVEPCAIGMEACGSAHYWARRFRAMGHEVKLTPPIYVKPYVKRGKNDAADAAAICEAMSRPNMRFVAVKSEDQQATLMAHKTRELLIKQRTMSVNALRGHLAEFGVIAAKGISHVEELVERAAAADLPAMVQATLGVLLAQLRSLDAAIDELERAIVADHRRDRSAGWRRASPASARSPLRRFWPARQIRRPSNPAAISPPGLARRPSRTRPAARRNSVRSPSRAIGISDGFWCWAPSRFCGRRQSARARCATGWPRSERANRPRSWPWRWPTSSPGSSGRS